MENEALGEMGTGHSVNGLKIFRPHECQPPKKLHPVLTLYSGKKVIL